MPDSQPIQSTKPADPNFTRAKAMIEARDYKGSLPLLQQVVAKDPRNADAYNLMGYATRSAGDPNGSLQYYQQALAIDPRHLGAHEYIGEAYLMLNRPADAQQHLALVDLLCVFGCTEYRQLEGRDRQLQRGQAADELARSRGPSSVRHQQWRRHAGQQRAAGAAQHEFAHARMAVDSHDDEIDIVIGGA